MDKSLKIKAEIESRLNKLGVTLNQLKEEAERQKEIYSAVHLKSLEAIEEKQRQAKTKLGELADAGEEHRHRLSSELEHFMGDIDDNLREAMKYFK